MNSRLIGLDKHPGVQHVDMGETWSYMMAKCVLKVAGQEVKETCGMEKFYGGVEAGI